MLLVWFGLEQWRDVTGHGWPMLAMAWYGLLGIWTEYNRMASCTYLHFGVHLGALSSLSFSRVSMRLYEILWVFGWSYVIFLEELIRTHKNIHEHIRTQHPIWSNMRFDACCACTIWAHDITWWHMISYDGTWSYGNMGHAPEHHKRLYETISWLSLLISSFAWVRSHA